MGPRNNLGIERGYRWHGSLIFQWTVRFRTVVGNSREGGRRGRRCPRRLVSFHGWMLSRRRIELATAPCVVRAAEPSRHEATARAVLHVTRKQYDGTWYFGCFETRMERFPNPIREAWKGRLRLQEVNVLDLRTGTKDVSDYARIVLCTGIRVPPTFVTTVGIQSSSHS